MWYAYVSTRFGEIPVALPGGIARLGAVKELAAWAGRYHAHVTLAWRREAQ